MIAVVFSVLVVSITSNNTNKSPHEFSTSYTGGYSIKGYTPSSVGKHPLYIWLTGTGMDSWGIDAQQYTQYMASHGVVGASVFYNSDAYPVLCSGFRNKAESIFNISNEDSAIGVLCKRSDVDCTMGVVVSGFSQGAQLTSLAKNYAGNIVKAIYESAGGNRLTLTGIGPGFVKCLSHEYLTIPTIDIRSVIGESDDYFGRTQPGLQHQQEAITGQICSNGTYNCMNSDGSGWYILLNSQPASGKAIHCYAYQNANCSIQGFDDQYSSSTSPWSLTSNLNWLITKLKK